MNSERSVRFSNRYLQNLKVKAMEKEKKNMKYDLIQLEISNTTAISCPVRTRTISLKVPCIWQASSQLSRWLRRKLRDI